MIEEGFWRGAVNINTSPPTGDGQIKPIVAASHASVETIEFNRLCGSLAPHHNVGVVSRN
jgi:hypothetical protein